MPLAAWRVRDRWEGGVWDVVSAGIFYIKGLARFLRGCEFQEGLWMGGQRVGMRCWCGGKGGKQIGSDVV